MWKSLSLITLQSEYATEFEAALISLVHLLITSPPKCLSCIRHFAGPLVPIYIICWQQFSLFFLSSNLLARGFKMNLKFSDKKYRGYEQYPIKLFYDMSYSVFFQTVLVSNMYFISHMLYNKFKDNWIIGLLGNLHLAGSEDAQSSDSIPISGLVYWISLPRDLLYFIPEYLLRYQLSHRFQNFAFGFHHLWLWLETGEGQKGNTLEDSFDFLYISYLY